MENNMTEVFENAIKESTLDDVEIPAGISKEGLEGFLSILSIPDDKFAMVAPIFYEEYVKSLSDDAYKYDALASLKKQGGSVSELRETAIQLADYLKADTTISDAKKEFICHLIEMTADALAEIDVSADFTISIPIQMINPDAKIPAYARPGDAGMDVFATCDMDILPGETKLMPLGFKVALPSGYELQVRPKSGLSLKSNLRVANAPGTIDSGYRDECGVILQNCAAPIQDWGPARESCLFGSVIHIDKGQKIAQFVLQKVPTAVFKPVEDIGVYGGDRGGGFGSTGLK